jgi:5'-3' exonuclease
LDITASLGSPLSPRALTMPLMGSSLTERSKSLQMLIRGYSARDHDYKKPGLSKCGQMTASILNMLAQVESTKRRAIMDREAAEYAVFLLDTKFKELGHECCGRRKLIGDKEDRERLALLEWFARAQIQAEEAAAERLILCSRMALLDLDMTDLAIHFGWEKIEIAEIEAQRRLSEVESRATAELSKNFRFLTKYFRNSMGKFNAQSCQRV